MKIVHINKFFSPIGGAETMMLEEARAFQAKGHEVFFYGTDRKPFFDDTLPYLTQFSKYTHYGSLSKFKLLKNIPKIIYDRDAEKKFEGFVDQIKPDIIHCHEFFYNLTPSFLNVLKKKKIPAVMTIHTPRLVCPAGTLMKKKETLCLDVPCAAGNPVACVQNACVDKSTAKSAIFSLEYFARTKHRLLESIQFYLAPSQVLLDISKNSGLPREKFLLLHNFIDDQYFKSPFTYKKGNYFLYVGRLAHDKGVKYLIEAMNLLPRTIPLRIVGTGPQEAEFKALAERYNLTNITFVGHRSRTELIEEYKHCIANVLPCYCFEAFGLVIVEAFTQGKPVLASRIGAIPEIIEDGKNGFTFEPQNIRQLADYIQQLTDDSDLVERMGRNARQKAEAYYTAEHHYQRLLEIYYDAIHQSQN